MKISNLTVCVCSRETDTEKADFIKHLKDTCGFNVHVMFLVNNGGVSLTQIYQNILDRADTEVVIFVHDDIEFLKPNWGKEIARLFDEHQDYGIIGVAGSAEFNNEAAWWRNKKIYGQVLHRKDGKSWLTAFSPLLKQDLEEVCVIDGVFMAVNKKRISKGFDAAFQGFNFYDIDFCMANFIDGQTKIGVTTNIRLAHNSVGELSSNWFENREKFNEKYKNYLPIEV